MLGTPGTDPPVDAAPELLLPPGLLLTVGPLLVLDVLPLDEQPAITRAAARAGAPTRSHRVLRVERI
jgi:hypothetical protein